MNLGIYIWDVSHGLAVTIVTPYKRVLAYNAGRSATFSPLQMLSGIGVIWLDCFVLSHPHPDHLRDIDALIALRPLLLWRRKLPKERIREGAEPGREESVVDRYQRELDHVYTQPATPSPTDYGWGGCEFRAFSPPEHPNLNNTSIVLFAGYGGGYVCIPGDLEKDGWTALIARADFRAYLAQTTVLLTPHHGRETGVCQEAFALMKPQLCVTSEGPYSPTSPAVYSALATEASVRRRSTGLIVPRRALSTRKDGHVAINFSAGSWTASIA